MANLDLSIPDCRLTTAQILYRMPDYPSLLQTFVWQDYDIAPQFPQLVKFLKFWEKEIDGSLHSILVAHQELIFPGEFKFVNGSILVH